MSPQTKEGDGIRFLDARDGSILEAGSVADGDEALSPGVVICLRSASGRLRHYRIVRMEEGGRIVYLQPAKSIYGKLLLLALALIAVWFALDWAFKRIF